MQVLLQVSVLTVLPSSHCSVPATTPSPQTMQAERGPPQSVPVSLWFLTPSVQVARMQVVLQVSVLTVLPSSHCSVPATMPSPQTMQAEQGPPQSVPVSLWFLTPSVQVARMQVLLQVSVLTVLPSSHCSAPATTPSPQTMQ